jgi:hypothetical protein
VRKNPVITRHPQDAAGTRIKKIVQALRTAPSAPDLTNAARDILKRRFNVW